MGNRGVKFYFFLLLNTIRYREQVKELVLSEIENDTLLKRNKFIHVFHAPHPFNSTMIAFMFRRCCTLYHFLDDDDSQFSSLSPFNEINFYPLSWLTSIFLRKFHLKITKLTFFANQIRSASMLFIRRQSTNWPSPVTGFSSVSVNTKAERRKQQTSSRHTQTTTKEACKKLINIFEDVCFGCFLTYFFTLLRFYCLFGENLNLLSF